MIGGSCGRERRARGKRDLLVGGSEPRHNPNVLYRIWTRDKSFGSATNSVIKGRTSLRAAFTLCLEIYPSTSQLAPQFLKEPQATIYLCTHGSVTTIGVHDSAKKKKNKRFLFGGIGLFIHVSRECILRQVCFLPTLSNSCFRNVVP